MDFFGSEIGIASLFQPKWTSLFAVFTMPVVDRLSIMEIFRSFSSEKVILNKSLKPDLL